MSIKFYFTMINVGSLGFRADFIVKLFPTENKVIFGLV